MSIQTLISKKIIILSKQQKKEFNEYLPSKVYKTERNISVLVALTQLTMMILFIANKRVDFSVFNRSTQYFALYSFLFISTIIAIFTYRYTLSHKKTKLFLWTRRIYACMLFIWVIGITILEQQSGGGFTVFCYLMPTMAALLLLTPIESITLIVGVWVILMYLLITHGNTSNIFGDVVNSTFVMILTLFISFRYYQSMAVEFCDRQTIVHQYKEIENSNALLEKIAKIDQLTGLYNRHYLMESLYDQIEVYKEKGYYGMFLMLDIDYFKQYNDTYGHIQGDECLKSLAKILKQYCREYDANAIRFGGEEFLVIKLSYKYIDGERFAQSLKDKIYEANIERSDVDLKRISVSMGVWNGCPSDEVSIEESIKRADNALYDAKRKGRNCIVLTK